MKFHLKFSPNKTLKFKLLRQDTTAEDVQMAFMKKLQSLDGPKKSAKNKYEEMCKINEAYQYLIKQRAMWEHKIKLQLGK